MYQIASARSRWPRKPLSCSVQARLPMRIGNTRGPLSPQPEPRMEPERHARGSLVSRRVVARRGLLAARAQPGRATVKGAPATPPRHRCGGPFPSPASRLEVAAPLRVTRPLPPSRLDDSERPPHATAFEAPRTGTAPPGGGARISGTGLGEIQPPIEGWCRGAPGQRQGVVPRVPRVLSARNSNDHGTRRPPPWGWPRVNRDCDRGFTAGTSPPA